MAGINYLFSKYPISQLFDVSKLDTSQCTEFLGLFYDSKLEEVDVSFLNTLNAISLRGLFNYATELKTIKNLDKLVTDKITDFGYMFNHASKLTNIDVSKFKTGNGKYFDYMFADTRIKFIDISNFDFSKATNLGYMFFKSDVSNSLDFKGIPFRTAVDVTYMFYNCRYLETILNLNVKGGLSLADIFRFCTKLTNLTIKNIQRSLTVGQTTSWGTLLTDASIINTFQELWDNTNNALGGTRTLTLSTPSNARTEQIYVKLIPITDEMRAEDEDIDNKKPCVVCESTDEGAMTLKEYGISKNWNIA